MMKSLLKKWNLLKTKLVTEPEWANVYQSMDEIGTQMRKIHLESHDIEAQMFNQKDSSYGMFGYIYLSVRKADEQKALELLKQYDE